MKQGVRALLVLACGFGVPGCGARGEPAPQTLPAADAGMLKLVDSLVLTFANGNTVWMAEGRRGVDSAGNSCVERSLEVHRTGARLKVPLLYTRIPPIRLDDSTFRAELFRDCTRMAAYRINVRDAMPYKIPQ